MAARSRNVLLDSGVYALARGGPAVINVFAVVLLTRLLPPDAYGAYALVMAGVGLAVGISLGWLRQGLLRFLPSAPEGGAVVLGTVRTAFGAIVLLSALIAAVIAATGALRDHRTLLGLGVVLFWVQGWYEVQRDLARVRLRPGRYGWLSVTRAGVFFAGAVSLAWAGWGAVGVVASAVLASAVALVMVRLTARDADARTDPSRARVSTLRELAGYGSPLAVSYVLWYVVSTSDRFILGIFSGADSVGLYSASYDLVDKALGMVMLVLYLAFFPVVVRRFGEEGEEKARGQLAAYFGVLAAVAVPAGAGTLAIAPELAKVLVGEEYRAAATLVIPWIAAGAVISGLKLYYVDIAFLLSRRTSLQMLAVGVTAAFNVGLNLLLIPRHGVLGAAWATLASAVVVVVLSAILSRSAFRLEYPQELLVRPVLAAAGMVAAIRAVGGPGGSAGLAFKIGLGVVVYGALLTVFDRFGRGPRIRDLVGQLAYSETPSP